MKNIKIKYKSLYKDTTCFNKSIIYNEQLELNNDAKSSESSESSESNQSACEVIMNDKNIVELFITESVLSAEQFIKPVCNFPFGQRIKILVLSGGGIKGISHIGAIKCLEKLNILKDIDTFIGTSIGSFISGMLCMGYTPKEIKTFVFKLNYELIKDTDFNLFIESYGLDDGTKIEHIIKTLIKQKFENVNITLNELFKITNKTFISVTTCVNTGNTHYLDHINSPNIPLYIAIKMSLSIPFLFCPVVYNGVLYADGGLTCNYPIDIFSDRINEVFGVYLYNISKKNTIESLQDYIIKLIFSATDNVTCELLKKYIKNTTIIKLENMEITNFDVTLKQKKELYLKGLNTCLDKLCPSV